MIVLYTINLIYNLDTVKEENKMLSKQQIQYYEKHKIEQKNNQSKIFYFLISVKFFLKTNI